MLGCTKKQLMMDVNIIFMTLVVCCCLQEIIIKFARVPEPEFPGHVLLEQYQAQV